MRALTRRESRLLAIGLLIVVLLLVEAVLIAPLVAGFAARAEERALLRTTYARNARLIDALPALRRQAEAKKDEVARFAIAAPNAALARDRLKERLRAQFEAAGGEVSAIQDVPAGPGAVHAWIEGRLTLAQLQDLLLRLGNVPPYLVFDSLRISADAALQSGHLEPLDVRLEASVPYTLAAS